MIAIFKEDVDVIFATKWFDRDTAWAFFKEAVQFISVAFGLTLLASVITDIVPNGIRIENAIEGIIDPTKWDVIACLGLTMSSLTLWLSVLGWNCQPLRRFSGGILQMSATWGLISTGCFLAIFTLKILKIETWSVSIAFQGTTIFISVFLLIYINSVLWFSRHVITDQKTYERIKPQIDRLSFKTKFLSTFIPLCIFTGALLIGV